ncbi:MAG: SDR family oxidoreductase [Kiloniellales bacterium]
MSGDGLVLLLGATSDIARAIARAFAADGHGLALAGRRPEAVEREAADLRIRFGVTVTVHPFDVLDAEAVGAFLDGLPELPEIAVSVVGLLGDQRKAETDPRHAALVIRSNFEGPAQVLAALAERFAARGSGVLVGVSSVAGERGRASNYFYGSAKAGFTAFLSGLRARMARYGVRVITVKPGFVDTRMTAGMRLPPVLTAQPEEVARAVLAAVGRGRDVVYVRRVWRLVMAAIRALPEWLFKRVPL